MILERLLSVGLTNAALGTLLAAGLWLAWRCARAPRALRLLAVVVLLRFLMPPLLPLGLFHAGDAQGYRRLAPAEDELPRTIESLRVAAEDAGPATAPRWSRARLEALRSWSKRSIFAGWAVGILTVACIGFCRQRSFRHTLRSAEPPPPAVSRRAAELSGRLGIAEPPTIQIVDRCSSPAVLATPGRPIVVLPRALLEELDPEELDTVLVHELAHVRRKDGLVRCLEIAACTLFWWNPAVWWTRRRLRDAEEACCDGIVLHHLPRHGPAYASALVKALSLTQGRPVPATASTMSSVQRTEERLQMILDATPPREARWLTATVAVLALALIAVFPTFSQDDDSELDGPAAIEAARQQDLRRRDLDLRELQLKAQQLEKNSSAVAERESGVLRAEEELMKARVELEERQLELEARRLRETAERRQAELERQLSPEIEERLEEEVRRQEATQAQRRAELEKLRAELELSRRERQERAERLVRAQEEAKARRRAEAEALRTELELATAERRARDRAERERSKENRLLRARESFELARRQAGDRDLQASVDERLRDLGEILQRLGDDGTGSRQLEELGRRLEELIEQREQP